MNIKIIVLSNGDKVIGELGTYDRDGNYVDVDKKNCITIKNAFVLKEIISQEGFSIIPLLLVPSDDKEIKINFDHVVVKPCSPKKEVYDMYKKMTSNILLPKSNGEIKLV